MIFRDLIIKDFMQKAKKTYEIRRGLSDEGFQFVELLIYCWISFEAFTCMQYNLERVRDRINSFCDEFQDRYSQDFASFPDDFKENLVKLSRETVKDMSPNHQDRPPKQINNSKNLKEVFDVIYQIRCNLFHGGKHINEIGDRAKLEFSAIVLYRILEKFLKERGILL